MFQNIKDLLAKLKLVQEAIKTKNLDKIGDVIEEVAKLLGYGAYGVLTDDILDAINAKDWPKLGNAVGDMIKLVANNITPFVPVPNPLGNAFGTPLTSTTDISPCPNLDVAISVLEGMDQGKTTFTHNGANAGPIDPKTGLPIGVWILLGQAAFEIFKIWREHRKNKGQ